MELDGCNGGALRTNDRDSHAGHFGFMPNEVGRPLLNIQPRAGRHVERSTPPPTEPSVTTPRALAGTRRQGSNSTNSELDSYKINNISINVLYMREDES